MHNRASWAALLLAAAGSIGTLAGCTDPNQVVVRVEDNRDIEGARAVAEQTCAHRGRRARLIAVINQNNGPRSDQFEPRPPDAVFECDPLPAP
jgi:hypothetical protein